MSDATCNLPGRLTGRWCGLVLALALVVLGSLPVASPGRAAGADGALAEFGRYRALVIGINAYRTLPPLETAVNDASAVHDLLSRRYGFQSDLLLNPSRYDLVRALDRLRAELGEDDNLLIYYAGHGVLDEATDEGFWLPIDAEEDSQANWVAVSTITRTLKAIVAKHVLVVSDSCYSGALTRDVPALLATGGDRMAELRRIARKRARKTLTSGGIEPVADGGGDGHSVFARAFLDILAANEEVLDGHGLYTRLRRPVILNSDQTPRYADIRNSGDQGGDFLFIPLSAAPTLASADAAPAAAPPAAVDERILELAFWDSVQASDDPALLQTYLNRYPEGVFAELATVRIATLKESGKTATTRAAPANPALVHEKADAPDPLEEALWQAVEGSTLPSVVQAYLDAYPQGRYAALAQVKLLELQAKAAPEPATSAPAASTATLAPIAPIAPIAPSAPVETPGAEVWRLRLALSGDGSAVRVFEGDIALPEGRSETDIALGAETLRLSAQRTGRRLVLKGRVEGGEGAPSRFYQQLAVEGGRVEKRFTADASTAIRFELLLTR
ncbi:caspase family protein [Oceanibacterium hippocampi]|uniref:Caspase domain protein n=1 Tax=Oceanibacterium hippocampi TaxID=745714 RepID=A0A1Y5SN36_9PROT|nr:caspase family protein [Oceanibacterium hippocampi]SLN41540.1 Caspase domain protein [Oceanibacterium hippocampi]